MSESASFDRLPARPDARADCSVAQIEGQPRSATARDGAFFMNTTESVLIVGASTRAAAYSASRAGLKPRCLDYFRGSRPCVELHGPSSECRRGCCRPGTTGREAWPRDPGSSPVHSRIIPISSSESHEPIDCAAMRPRPCAAPAIHFAWSRCCARGGFLTWKPSLTPGSYLATEAGWSNRSPRREAVSSSTWTTRRLLSPSRATFSSSSMALATPRFSSLSEVILSSSA